MHPVRIPSQDDVLQVFRKAGFSALSPFQEKLIPFILKGKDVAAQVAPGSGKTVGFVLPLILGLRGAGLAPRARHPCVKLGRGGNGDAYVRPHRPVRARRARVRAARGDRGRPPGAEAAGEGRQQSLSGTSERVIDHIRRGSLGFDELQTIIVEEPEGDARADFIKDVQFIFAKIADRRQTILFSRSAAGGGERAAPLLRHPVVLDAAQSKRRPVVAERSGHLYCPDRRRTSRAEILARVILGDRIPSALVYHSPRIDSRRIAEALSVAGNPRLGSCCRGQRLRSGVAPARRRSRRKVLAAFPAVSWTSCSCPCHRARSPAADLEELAPSHVVFFDIPPAGNRPVSRHTQRGDGRRTCGPGTGKGAHQAPGGDRRENQQGGDPRRRRGAHRRHRQDPAQDEDRGPCGADSSCAARIRRQVPLLLGPSSWRPF